MQYSIYFLACSYAHSRAFALLTNYKNEKPQSVFIITGRFDYHAFDVHICFPLSLLQNRTNEFFNFTEIKKDTDKLLKNLTLKQLNDDSLPPEEFIKKIYYNYYYKLSENELDVKKPTSFAYTNSNYSNLQIYSKCFAYKVHKLKEPNYRNLQRETRFIVETKTKVFSVYVTGSSKILTPYDKQQILGHNVDKIVENIDPADKACEFYEKAKMNCTSYHNCLTRCVISKFVAQFKKIPSHLVLDEEIWTKNQNLKYDIDCKDKLFNITNECEKNLKPDCKLIHYRPGKNKKRLKINYFYLYMLPLK